MKGSKVKQFPSAKKHRKRSKAFISWIYITKVDSMLGYIRKCPRCNSKDVNIWMGANLGIIYSCKNCGYRGPLIVEEDSEN